MSPRAANTKRALFEATLELATSRGLAEISVDEIAARAGVAKGSVYYNFASKDGLVEALLRYGVDLLAGRLRAARDTENPSDGLDSTVDSALGFIEQYPGFAQILVSELWRTSGQWQETLQLLRGEVVAQLGEQLRDIANSSGLPAGVEVSTASAGLFGTLLVVGLDWRVFQPHLPRQQVRDSITMLARGTAAPLR